MLETIRQGARRRANEWLRQGVSPGCLAFTLALGFVLGCIPILGTATPACFAIAFALRLNHPAIQTANYAASPLQGLFIFPFYRLGSRMVPLAVRQMLPPAAGFHEPMHRSLVQLMVLPCEALLGWLVVAGPAVAVITLALTPVLRTMAKRFPRSLTETAPS